MAPIDRAAWTPTEARAWVERHGGNVSALARRLGVHRTRLQGWLSEDGRELPPYIQRHMETLDQLEGLASRPTP